MPFIVLDAESPRYCVRAWQPWERREGRLRIVFHAHNSDMQVHPRHMYIGSASFQEEAGGASRLVISQEFIVSVIAE